MGMAHALEPDIPDWMQLGGSRSQVAWAASVHAKEGVKCIACHGEGSEPLSSLKEAEKPQAWDRDEVSRIEPKKRKEYDALCARCHQGAVENFYRTFHGKHALLGKQNIPTCSYCHLGHEAALSAQMNPLHADTLGRVCAGCHGGSSEQERQVMALNLAGSGTGKTLYGKDQFGLGALRIGHLIDGFYLALIALVIGFLVFYIYLDLPVALRERRASPATKPHIRHLTTGQRVQHVVLALSFITLAMSGFAVKYPDSAYADWLVALVGGADNRSLIHRLAAIAFVGNAYIHFMYYLLTRRNMANILLSRQDLQDAWQDVRFRLGLGQRPAGSGKYHWLQKLEYWAGVIGLNVVLVTGLLMWFFEWTLSYFPYQVFKYAQWIHGWEAILATLTIILLHGYSTMLNPRVFPMDWSWITGKKTEERRGSTSGD
ncbi:MAG: cytochrome b/b6 domain-containing protein [Cellvibrionaceae bacterium]|nr:cytochrome b/b6 domain-containing protein [Motiliproteus sp.]